MSDDRMARMSLAQWYALVAATIRDGDFEATADALAAMSIYGFAPEAERLRMAVALIVGGA